MSHIKGEFATFLGKGVDSEEQGLSKINWRKINCN